MMDYLRLQRLCQGGVNMDMDPQRIYSRWCDATELI